MNPSRPVRLDAPQTFDPDARASGGPEPSAGRPSRSEPTTLVELEISEALARLYKTHVGRGPSRVRTVLSRDVVVCVVEAIDVPMERTLLQVGADDLVHAARLRLQTHMAEALTTVVERATGRRVSGHVPGCSMTADAATETFLLGDPTD